ncbi:MAG: hypothetical protein DME65_08675 [Verrucomicrobia bacterium]|nr:MAG: hypothetical protein DME65_08675 [Verrucomicrobiota bacterium]
MSKRNAGITDWEIELIVNICEMTQEEEARLESIEELLRSESIRQEILPIVERVRAELARKNEALMTWEPIPLNVFGGALPAEIQSAWVFVLRAGVDTGPERHPNSHQRMMTFDGSGDMRTRDASQWRSNVLVSNSDAPLEQRWISIPRNVWHRPVVGPDADWTVVSFHTVPAEELIEEKPDDSSKAGTKQTTYLSKK